VARANDAAADNKVNGAAVTFAASDVVLGKWNTQTRVFSPNATPYDAVKLTGTSVVPLMLGGVINKPSVTIRVSAVARTASLGGLIGLNGITFNNNAFIGSYDSSVTTAPTPATANSNAVLSTNSALSADKHIDVKGSAYYGSLQGGWTMSGESKVNTTPIVPPTQPTWAPVPNPGSITNGNYVSSGGTLNGGTYWFTGLTINGSLTFNGPTTIYVNGDILMDGNNSALTAYQDKPPNLKIYQIGTGRLFTSNNSANIKSIIIAPGSKFEAKNNMDFYGLAIFDTITMKNNTNIFFDESAYIDQSAALVQ